MARHGCSEETKANFKAIRDQLEGIIVHLKEIDTKIGIQNGRIYKAEEQISLIKQASALEKEYTSFIDNWSRTKVIAVGSIILTFLFALIQIAIERIFFN